MAYSLDIPAEHLQPGLSVVVPVFRSESTLRELADRLEPVLRSLSPNFELIFVNDASPDHSWKVICELASARSWVRGIDLMTNSGQHSALVCGIRAATFGTVVTMDDDLQHPPESIPLLIARLREGLDLVYGSPIRRRHSLLRNAFSRALRSAVACIGVVPQALDITSFRAMRTSLRAAFAHCVSANLLDAMLFWNTPRYATVPVPHDCRKTGRSTYSPSKLYHLAATLITAFTTAPLRIVCAIGFTMLVVAAVAAAYAGIRTWRQGDIDVTSFVVALVLFLSGINLAALGVVGEYIARIFDRSMQRPAYQIKTMAGTTDNPHA